MIKDEKEDLFCIKLFSNFEYKEIANIDIEKCESITIPSFVENLNPKKFMDFNKLREIKIADNNPYLKQSCNNSSHIVLDGTSNNKFSFSNALQNVKIAQSLERIDNATFEHCINLESVTFDKDLAENCQLHAGSRVFSGCYRLKRVNINNFDFLDYYNCDNYSCPFMYGAKAFIKNKEVVLNCKKRCNEHFCDVGMCKQNNIS